ncbi:MAG: hypothetical protein KA436_12875 [Oligoflexales bacterium]|nr:hypothetical protein [Oligoflexales bacterium]
MRNLIKFLTVTWLFMLLLLACKPNSPGVRSANRYVANSSPQEDATHKSLSLYDENAIFDPSISLVEKSKGDSPDVSDAEITGGAYYIRDKIVFVFSIEKADPSAVKSSASLGLAGDPNSVPDAKEFIAAGKNTYKALTEVANLNRLKYTLKGYHFDLPDNFHVTDKSGAAIAKADPPTLLDEKSILAEANQGLILYSKRADGTDTVIKIMKSSDLFTLLKNSANKIKGPISLLKFLGTIIEGIWKHIYFGHPLVEEIALDENFKVIFGEGSGRFPETLLVGPNFLVKRRVMGKTLADIIDTGKLDDVKIADLANTLREIASNNVALGDLNAGNFIWDEKTGKWVLIDAQLSVKYDSPEAAFKAMKEDLLIRVQGGKGGGGAPTHQDEVKSAVKRIGAGVKPVFPHQVIKPARGR